MLKHQPWLRYGKDIRVEYEQCLRGSVFRACKTLKNDDGSYYTDIRITGMVVVRTLITE